MKWQIKIIRAPKDEIIETKQKKSKAILKYVEKIQYFFECIKNFPLYYTKTDFENLSDARLADYIDFLNKKNDSLDKVADKINDRFMKKEDTVVSDIEKAELLNETQDKLNTVLLKKEKAQAELERATDEVYVRDQISKLEDPIEEEFDKPTEVEPMKEVEIQPIEEPTVEKTEEPVVETPDEVTESMNIEIKDVRDVQDSDFKNDSLSKMEQIEFEYNTTVKSIEKNYKESFSRDIGELVARVMNETEKYADAKINEISEVSKEAIAKANDNTKNALEEKANVEQDRDNYKNNYEETLKTIEQRDQTIKSKDEEIASLKAEIEKKNNELAAANERELSLNATLDKKNKNIKDLSGQVINLKISLATVAQQVLNEAKEESLDLSEPIEPSESVESEEPTKTM